MVCTYFQKFTVILLAVVAIYFVDGAPSSQFSSTSYTSDSNGSHTVVVDGDDSGTRVGVGSGPPAQASDSNSNVIMSRFASPAATPAPNQVFYIPAGQSQTISAGGTVIQTRMGSGSSGTGSTGAGAAGGTIVQTRLGSGSTGTGYTGTGYTGTGSTGTGAAGGTIVQTRMGGGSIGAGSASQASSNNGGAYGGAYAAAGSFSSHQTGSSSSNDDYNYNNDGYDN